MGTGNPLHRVRKGARRALSPLVWANFLAVTLATAVTAVAGLVADDLLPKPPAASHLIIWPRAVWLLILLVALLGALWLRSRVHRTTGTLFHVQVLAEQMADLQADGRDNAEENRMAVRSVTRWVDLVHRTGPDGVVELADVCADVSNAVEAQVNADSIDTGYTLAPVMLWPIAVAVGTQLPLPGRLRLVELQAGGKPTNNIELAAPARTIVVRREATTDPPSDGRVGVLLAFTAASRHFARSSWAGFGVTTDYRVTLGPDLPGPEPLTDDDIAGLGAAIAAALVQIKDDTRGRELVVVAMITKVVAVAIGWHIAQHTCRFFDGTHLMHYDEDTARFLPLRVKESQPAHAPRTI